MKISVLNSGLTITDLGVIIDSILSEQADGVFAFIGVPDGQAVIPQGNSMADAALLSPIKDATELQIYKCSLAGTFAANLATGIGAGGAETVSMTRENGRYLTTTAEGNVAELVSGNANFKRLGTFGELADAVSKGKVLSSFECLLLDQPQSGVHAMEVTNAALAMGDVTVLASGHVATITEISKLSRGFGE